MRRPTHVNRRGAAVTEWNPSMIPNAHVWYRADKGVTLSLASMGNPSEFGSWSLFAATVSSDATTDPFGTSTADKIVENGAAGTVHVVQKTPTNYVAESQLTTTFSCYLKAAGRTSGCLRIDASNYAIFDLTNGTILDSLGVTTATATSAGSGWYLCTITFTASLATGTLKVGPTDGLNMVYAGNSTDGVYAYLATVTQSPNRVSAWADQEPTSAALNLTQSTAANQPTLTTAGAVLKYKPTLVFDGVSDRLAGANAADWIFLHSGAGTTIVIIHKPTNGSVNGVLFDTGSNTAATSGAYVLYGGANTNYFCTITNGSGTRSVSTASAVGSAPLNTANILIFRHGTASSPQFSLRTNGLASSSGSYLAATSSATPVGALRIGSQVAGGFPYEGSVPEVVIFSRYLTDAECIAIEAYKTRRYG